MASNLVRTNLMLPKDLLEELDRHSHNRSEYVRRILENSLAEKKLDLERRLAILEEVRGAWKGTTVGKSARATLKKLRTKGLSRTRQLLEYARK